MEGIMSGDPVVIVYPDGYELLVRSRSHPPEQRTSGYGNALGASAEEISEFALGGLTRRLKVIGVSL
jgi:hypothetical protein